MADPTILGEDAKAAAVLIAPVFKAVKGEIARRDADSKALSLTDLDSEICDRVFAHCKPTFKSTL